MTRLLALLSIIAAPIAATADDTGHQNRITWQVSTVMAATATASHADRITWQFESADTAGKVTRPTAAQRSGHADIITWACPEAKDLIN